MKLTSRRLYSQTSRFFVFPVFDRASKADRGDFPYHNIGAIQGLSAGTFALMPVAQKIVERLTSIIDHEFQAIDSQKISLPSLSHSSLWHRSGRWDRYGPVLFRLKDRAGHDFCLGPTHEETMTQCIANLGPATVASKLPIKLYQTSWKFRDEERPKRGLLRAREFLMTDLYSFDSTIENCQLTYNLVAEAYHKIFTRIGLPYIKVLASSGDMGGSFSHEYHYQLPIGEDTIYSCERCKKYFNEEALQNNSECPICSLSMDKLRGVEIGHTFILGDYYSKVFDAKAVSQDKNVLLQMGCYGLGVTRIMSAAAQFASRSSLLLPVSIAPFTVGVVPPKQGSHEFEADHPKAIEIATGLDTILPSKRVILDDRNWTIGRKIRELKSNGIPYQVVLGKKGLEIHKPNGEAMNASGIETVLNFFRKLTVDERLL